jgi:DNA polymerase II small subunit/DNA polymerase delta subunit B
MRDEKGSRVPKPTKKEREQALAVSSYHLGKRHGREEFIREFIELLKLNDIYEAKHE